MIIADLKNSSRYEILHPKFKEIFEIVKKLDWFNIEIGKTDIKGDNWFIINSNPECMSKQSQVLEYHKKYLDIHILLEGEEIIGWKSLNDCVKEKKSFDEQEDYGLYEDTPTTYVTLYPNQFAIVYPEDAHAPIIGEDKIRKLIVKVEV